MKDYFLTRPEPGTNLTGAPLRTDDAQLRELPQSTLNIGSLSVQVAKKQNIVNCAYAHFSLQLKFE